MKRRLQAGLVAVSMVLPALAAAPAMAQTGGRVTVLVDGLQQPRGVAADADGNVYVTESGTGGDELCMDVDFDGEPTEICMGTTSMVTRVRADGTVQRGHVGGLPSLALGEDDVIGASDVAIAADGTIYLTFGWGQSADLRDELVEDFPPAAHFGTLSRVAPDGSLVVVADLARWEQDNNPDDMPPEEPDSNPNGVHVDGDAIYVVDAGGNTLLEVDAATGEVDLLTLFPERPAIVPPFIGGDGTATMPMQAVPTSVTTDADGNVLVGQLTGFPFPAGDANVFEIDSDGTPVVRAAGLTAVTGVATRGDDLFAVQLARGGLLGAQDDPRGSIARIRPNGARTDLFAPELILPYGIAAGPDGMLYVSTGAVTPVGTLLRIDPSLAGDPALQEACPPDAVRAAGFTDIGDNVHGEAILCLAWHELFRGFDDGRFGPQGNITRGQFASAVVRLLDATGTGLPAGSRTFPDVGPSVHRDAIHRLANAGVVSGFPDGTFRAGAPITRAQAVTMMVGAYALTGASLPPATGGRFSDTAGSVHAGNIDRAAAAGWIAGTGDGRFAPGRSITRGQTASVLARVASTLVAEGELNLPNG
ncbi:ScyD/ScyE family protein [Egicoccus sp. AB-alg6-2]|uniref:ScyD/ScyE family protein n=1 Tax=Egicoccus sp. AB-alg6-2 TaxID=3242692 RepID=UPI00359EE600